MPRRLPIPVLFAAALVVVTAGPAQAHAAYKDSDPPNKSTVSSPPSSVWAEFTEPVTMDSSLAVTDPCGSRVDNGDSRVSGYRITVTMNGAAAGTYVVSFSVISAVDGHPTRGSFTFTSTGGAACPGEEPPPEDPGGGDGASNRGGNESRRGPGDSSTGTSDTAAPGDSDNRAVGGDGSRRRRGHRAHSPARRAGGRERAVAAPTQPAVALPVAPNPREPEAWDLPMDAFIAAIVVAAAIGAVGGRIYAGIIAPD